MPQGWSPAPGWEPDPAWPPAPPGWRFWVDTRELEVEEREPGSQSSVSEDVSHPRTFMSRRRRVLSEAPWLALSVIPVVVLVAAATVVLARPGVGIELMPSDQSVRDAPDNSTHLVDFASWARLGGIDARFQSGGSVQLDTRETVGMPPTRWAGLIRQGPLMCGFRLAGRVRDVSHVAGSPGGFGIGMAEPTSDDLDKASLVGSVIEFNFGRRGFRDVGYPDDSDEWLVPATLDNQWHDIEVVVTPEARALWVDGQKVLDAVSSGRCGHPAIRVWAGAVEFADVRLL